MHDGWRSSRRLTSCTVIHCPGKVHSNADALSRISCGILVDINTYMLLSLYCYLI